MTLFEKYGIDFHADTVFEVKNVYKHSAKEFIAEETRLRKAALAVDESNARTLKKVLEQINNLQMVGEKTKKILTKHAYVVYDTHYASAYLSDEEMNTMLRDTSSRLDLPISDNKVWIDVDAGGVGIYDENNPNGTNIIHVYAFDKALNSIEDSENRWHMIGGLVYSVISAYYTEILKRNPDIDFSSIVYAGGTETDEMVKAIRRFIQERLDYFEVYPEDDD